MFLHEQYEENVADYQLNKIEAQSLDILSSTKSNLSRAEYLISWGRIKNIFEFCKSICKEGLHIVDYFNFNISEQIPHFPPRKRKKAHSIHLLQWFFTPDLIEQRYIFQTNTPFDIQSTQLQIQECLVKDCYQLLCGAFFGERATFGGGFHELLAVIKL